MATVQECYNIKLLILLSIFFLPLTFVTSVFGMTNEPQRNDYRGLAIVVAVGCVSCFILIGYLNITHRMMDKGPEDRPLGNPESQHDTIIRKVDENPNIDQTHDGNTPASKRLNVFQNCVKWHQLTAWKHLSKGNARVWFTCKGFALLRCLRPRPKDGFCRLEWTCSCGQPMYGDYTSSRHGIFARKLSELCGKSIQNANSYDIPMPILLGPSTEIDSQTLSLGANSSSSKPASHGVGTANQRSSSPSSSSTTSSDGSVLSQVSSSTSISLPSSEAVPVQSYLELCVNRNKYLTRVGEIPIVNAEGDYLVKSDFELFGTLLCQD